MSVRAAGGEGKESITRKWSRSSRLYPAQTSETSFQHLFAVPRSAAAGHKQVRPRPFFGPSLRSVRETFFAMKSEREKSRERRFLPCSNPAFLLSLRTTDLAGENESRSRSFFPSSHSGLFGVSFPRESAVSGKRERATLFYESVQTEPELRRVSEPDVVVGEEEGY